MERLRQARLQIGDASCQTGLSIDTIRFYEKERVLPAPRRTAAGFRTYSPGDIERLQFIRRAQDLGFSLREIRELLLIESRSQEGCSHVRALIGAKIAQVQEKLADLRRLESRLKTAQQQCDDALVGSCGVECPILKQLSPEENR